MCSTGVLACPRSLASAKTWTFPKRLAIKKSAAALEFRSQPLPILSYLVCASPRGSGAVIEGSRRGGTKYITLRQATGLIEAVGFARSIGLPLVAHLTIHWSLTDVGDDPNGKLFAKTREGFHKWLGRRGIVFAAAWVRERQSGGRSDVEHCHLLFHLPPDHRAGRRLLQVEAAISRLVRLHGGGILHEKVVDLRLHDNPTANTSSRVAVPRPGGSFASKKSTANCRASSTASAAGPRKTSREQRASGA